MGVQDFGKHLIASPKQVRRAACRCGGLERIAWRTLRSVGPDRKRVIHLARGDMRQRTEHGLGAGLARELEVRDMHIRPDAESLGHHRAAGLDRVGVRLRTDVKSSDAARID